MKELEHKISIIVANYKRLKKACDSARASGTLDMDGPLFSAIWASFEALLLMTDSDGWISWYVYDNDCGAKQKKAGNGSSKLRPIKNERDLARVIIDIQKRNESKS